jgi:glycosyltransferase involved in cell wall biosynthesis
MGAILKALELFRWSPEKILAMRQNAVRRIQAHYTWDIVVERYLKLYGKALKLTGSTR